MIVLQDIFPNQLSYTDIVSYATDSYAAVQAKKFTALASSVKCGDVINAEGNLFNTGDATGFIVVSDFVPSGSHIVNVLRAPNVGSAVCIKANNLNATDKDAAIAFLITQGFQTQEFYTS